MSGNTLQQIQNILCGPFLYDFLKWRYRQYSLLERCGRTYPLAIFPAAAPQIRDAESALASPLEGSDRYDDFIVSDESYRRLIKKAGGKIENRPTFIYRSLITNGRVSLRCGFGRYFDGLDTCHALEWELLNTMTAISAENPGEQVFNEINSKLPWREKTHRHCGDPVRSGSGRSAFIGISVLICYLDGNDYYLWIQPRSARGSAFGAGLFHVIPSFVFQPVTSSPAQEYSILHNLKREYLEELFDRPEYAGLGNDHKYFYQDQRWLHLERLISEDRAGIYLAGIAVNLLNLRPEICLLLLINSRDWYAYHRENKTKENRFRLNDEWKIQSSEGNNIRKPAGHISIGEADESICKKFGPGKILPAGAAALWLGLDLLKHLGIRK